MKNPGVKVMSEWQLAPILGATNVNDTVNWYCDMLGFTCEHGVYQGVGDEGGIYGIIHRDGIQLHIQIRRREVQPPDRQTIESEVYLYVQDAVALEDEFKYRGVPILRGLTKGPNYDLEDFIIQDPNGNRLIFGSPPSSPAGQ